MASSHSKVRKGFDEQPNGFTGRGGRLNGEKIALAQNALDRVGFSNDLKKTVAPEKMILENSLAIKKFRP